MKKALALALALVFTLSIAGCGGGSESAATSESILDITGLWAQEGYESSDTYQAAVITNETIEVFWITDSGDTVSLYWAGTVNTPTGSTEPYSWDSANDTAKTEYALLASKDETKTFTVEKGELSYQVSMMGTTVTERLNRIDDVPADYVYETGSDESFVDGAEITAAPAAVETQQPTSESDDAVLTLDEVAMVAFESMEYPDKSHRVYSVEGNTITFGFWADGSGLLAKAYPTGRSTSVEALKFQGQWNDLVDTWVSISESVMELIQRSDTPDGHIVICMLDDDGQDEILLGIYDGEVKTDIVNGIE